MIEKFTRIGLMPKIQEEMYLSPTELPSWLSISLLWGYY